MINKTLFRGPQLGRRQTLLGLGAALTLGSRSMSFAAGNGSSRLVVINVKGGVDGLSLVAPYGDGNLRSLRAPLMAPAVRTTGGMIDLGGFYGLHPKMVQFGGLYQAGQGLVVHAVGNCASTRSHFVGQDYLQSGSGELLSSGWLNRASSFLPSPGSGLESAIAVNYTTPLLLRGSTPVSGWVPNTYQTLPTTGINGILAAAAPDPLLGSAMQVAFNNRTTLESIQTSWSAPASNLSSLAVLARTAGEVLATSNGPRIAALETGSFDTHANQNGTLGNSLAELDQAIDELQLTLSSCWSNTVVLTITEFGRTAAVNGSGGTDHGTAFAVLLAGGAVAGGRVVATWPGLSASQLFEGRDLAATVDVRSILMGVLRDHLGLSSAALSSVFPDAGSISPMNGLITKQG